MDKGDSIYWLKNMKIKLGGIQIYTKVILKIILTYNAYWVQSDCSSFQVFKNISF